MSELLHGLPPIVGPDPTVLVLGNMPSALSLTHGQYYGNPRNAFWPICAAIYGFDPNAPYEQRAAALTRHGIAVWDVLRCCRRAGSLDSAVERDSMVPNDFGLFLAANPTIDLLLFNGAAAEANYRRLVPDTPAVPSIRLPSTSPAHTMRFADKLAQWRTAMGR
ncbi:DNA-deoxyinosine glycosylase [Mycolicibacterium sp. P9-22]|uniref:DNA-deoxyinosine glycosylase n=1 Tax=Mycolicibacterium sp. P9-22 TaxID=2024613 RepID=UPI0011ECF7B1|nr:DNA-deoxyinosine glycosylase [Mycolicibacterium sp. P9-22]KAA0113625.1 DNA-deoxyinosine glycosylase [Mycolicibacterium sp. P9-22]